MSKIIIGNDHGGYKLKQEIVEYLEQKGRQVANVGSDQEGIVRYPYYAARVAAAVSAGEYDCGLLICSTGIGMSIIANKYKGVRAALVTDSYMARMTRLHNDSNILCLGGRILGIDVALDIVETWLTAEYMGGRHDISLGLIKEAESFMLGDRRWVKGRDEEK